jgi:hypothetical protein
MASTSTINSFRYVDYSSKEFIFDGGDAISYYIHKDRLMSELQIGQCLDLLAMDQSLIDLNAPIEDDAYHGRKALILKEYNDMNVIIRRELSINFSMKEGLASNEGELNALIADAHAQLTVLIDILHTWNQNPQVEDVINALLLSQRTFDEEVAIKMQIIEDLRERINAYNFCWGFEEQSHVAREQLKCSREIASLQKDLLKNRENFERRSDELENKFKDSVKIFDVKVIEREKKITKCFGIINKHFGPSVKAIYSSVLSETNDPREVFKLLDSTYMVMNRIDQVQMFKNSMNIVFNRSLHLSIFNFSKMMDRTFKAINICCEGTMVSECHKLAILIMAIENSSSYKDFSDELSFIQHINVSYEDALIRLIAKDNRLSVINKKADTKDKSKDSKGKSAKAFTAVNSESNKKAKQSVNVTTTNTNQKGKIEGNNINGNDNDVASPISSNQLKCKRCNKIGHIEANCKIPLCTHCKKLGHLRENCYKIHGFPITSNSNRASNSNTGNGNASSGNSNSNSSAVISQPFGDLPSDEDETRTVNYSNRNVRNSSATVLISTHVEKRLYKNSWILDSGCSVHMTPFKYNISNNAKSIVVNIELASEGMILKSTHIDSNLLIGDILLVPQLNTTLISTSQLEKEGYKIIISNGIFQIMKENSTNVVLHGKRKNNLYYFDQDSINLIISNIKSSSAMINSINKSFANIDIMMQLHLQLGHISETNIKRCVKDKCLHGLNHINYNHIKHLKLGVCDACIKGGMKKFDNPLSTSNTTYNSFELSAMDPIGPFTPIGIGGVKYMFVFADYKCHKYYWSCRGKHKTDVVEAIKKFHEFVNTTGSNINILQTDYDNFAVVNNKVISYCSKNGIVLRQSSPYVHEQNGFIERAIQTILSKARTLLIQFNCPQRYWPLAIEAAIYLLNRTPRAGLTPNNIYKTPYEVLYGEKPNLSWIIPFYSKAFYHVTKDERLKKFDPMARPCHIMGYADQSKQCHIIMTSNGTLLVRKDVIAADIYKQLCDSSNSIDNIDDIVVSSELEGEMEVIPPLTQSIPMHHNHIDSQLAEDYPNISEESDEYWTEPIVIPSNLPNMRSQKRKIQFITANNSATDNRNYFVNSSRMRSGLLPEIKAVTRYEVSSLSASTSTDSVALTIPKTFSDILNHPDKFKWIDAINKEMQTLKNAGTFTLINDQVGRAMKSKMVYDIRIEQDGNIKHKARLVACGYSQIEGIDYDNPFSPTAKWKTFLMLLCLACMYNWERRGLDISGAYLEGEVDRDLFLWLPPEVCNGKRTRVQLTSNLYGTVQAGKIWYDRFCIIMQECSLIRSINDVCLFYHLSNGIILYLLVYVDDIFIVSNSNKSIESLVIKIKDRVKGLKDSGSLSHYLGVNIVDNTNNISINQSDYINKVNFDDVSYKLNTNTKQIPMDPNFHSRIYDSTELRENLPPIHDRVGKFRYLADRTRADTLAPIGILGEKQINPFNIHYKESLRLLNYFKSTPMEGFSYGFGINEINTINMLGFCDASYITLGDSKSRLGYCLYLNTYSGAVCCKSWKDSSVSHSSCECELKALDALIREVQYFKNILNEIGFKVNITSIYIDNKASIEISNSLKSYDKVKHINMIINYIRENIDNKLVELKFVGSINQVADILTKPLAYIQHYRLKRYLLHGFDGADINILLV